MVPVNVFALIASTAPAPNVIVLKPVESESGECSDLVVPILVGIAEAVNLRVALKEARFCRPLTHDLFLDCLTALDARVDHVLIDRVKGHLFFAKLTISQHGRFIELDARPSDAISLAIRQNAPIYVEETVLETAGQLLLPSLQQEEDPDELEDFHLFLESIAPEDFAD